MGCSRSRSHGVISGGGGVCGRERQVPHNKSLRQAFSPVGTYHYLQLSVCLSVCLCLSKQSHGHTADQSTAWSFMLSLQRRMVKAGREGGLMAVLPHDLLRHTLVCVCLFVLKGAIMSSFSLGLKEKSVKVLLLSRVLPRLPRGLPAVKTCCNAQLFLSHPTVFQCGVPPGHMAH